MQAKPGKSGAKVSIGKLPICQKKKLAYPSRDTCGSLHVASKTSDTASTGRTAPGFWSSVAMGSGTWRATRRHLTLIFEMPSVSKSKEVPASVVVGSPVLLHLHPRVGKVSNGYTKSWQELTLWNMPQPMYFICNSFGQLPSICSSCSSFSMIKTGGAMIHSPSLPSSLFLEFVSSCYC